jgi:hypothetical protein
LTAARYLLINAIDGTVLNPPLLLKATQFITKGSDASGLTGEPTRCHLPTFHEVIDLVTQPSSLRIELS